MTQQVRCALFFNQEFYVAIFCRVIVFHASALNRINYLLDSLPYRPVRIKAKLFADLLEVGTVVTLIAACFQID